MRPRVALRLRAPCRGGKQTGRSEDHDRVNEQRDHRELHFPRAHFQAQVFRCTADHLARDEHTDDKEQEQVDHAHALAAEHAIEPHADHRG